MESLRRSRKDAEEGKRLRLNDHVGGCWVYEIEITAERLRHLNKLPDKVRHAALESIFGLIADNLGRHGNPLVGELEGLWSARHGDYRIIYSIFEDDQVVLIRRVQHRRDAYWQR